MKDKDKREEIYLAGGCLWGVQEFIPTRCANEAGRVNGLTNSTNRL